MSFSQLVARLLGLKASNTVSHDEMTDAVASGKCSIVDVREPHEYSQGHIPGAVNHPFSRFDPSLLVCDEPVILVCQAGGRSSKALQKALEAGHRNIRHYPPGTSGWKAHGGNIVM
jgi:rhodanese-related sulfurtransferase